MTLVDGQVEASRKPRGSEQESYGGSAGRWERGFRSLPAMAGALLGHRVRTPGAVVLAYHDVSPDPDAPDIYRVTPERFERHLDRIRGWGLEVVPLAEIVDRLEAGLNTDGLVAITFDDALVGVIERAVPILRDRGLHATVFVTTGAFGRPHPGWADARRAMTDREVAQLVEWGFAVGSHAVTHRPLPRLGSSEREAELAESRIRLEALSGGPVDLFAYPEGRHDAASREAVEGAGYRAAFGFVGGRVLPGDDMFALARVGMGLRHRRLRVTHDISRPASSWPPDPYLDE